MQVNIEVPSWAKHIISDFSDWNRNPQPVSKVAPSSLWQIELPENTYFEYAFLDADGKQHADPKNDNIAANPWYPAARALTTSNYKPDPYSQIKDIQENKLIRYRLESQHLGQMRRITSYTPLNHEHEALPIIYVQDGVAYYRIAKLHLVLEKLILEKKIRPAHIVFIEDVDREREYSYFLPYRQFMIEEVVPYAEANLACTDERIIMGASLGGLVSSVLAWENPEMFQSIITQSGAFLGSPEDKNYYRSEHSWVLEQLKHKEAKPLRWYCETGTLEWLYKINNNIAGVLKEKGYDYQYQERNAGHNWVNWRNGLSSALSFVLA